MGHAFRSRNPALMIVVVMLQRLTQMPEAHQPHDCRPSVGDHRLLMLSGLLLLAMGIATRWKPWHSTTALSPLATCRTVLPTLKFWKMTPLPLHWYGTQATDGGVVPTAGNLIQIQRSMYFAKESCMHSTRGICMPHWQGTTVYLPDLNKSHNCFQALCRSSRLSTNSSYPHNVFSFLFVTPKLTNQQANRRQSCQTRTHCTHYPPSTPTPRKAIRRPTPVPSLAMIATTTATTEAAWLPNSYSHRAANRYNSSPVL